MSDLPNFHPRRFPNLVGRTLSREFHVKLETMRMMRVRGRDDRQAIRSELMAKEFAQFSTVEILERQKREAAIGVIHRRWSEWGQVSFDISETLSADPAGATFGDGSPAIDKLPRSFFVHFGKQMNLLSSQVDSPYIEGAYVCTHPDHGPGYLEFAFVCGPPESQPHNTLAEILAIQSCVAMGAIENTSITSLEERIWANEIDERLRPMLQNAGRNLARSFCKIAAMNQLWEAGPRL